ncbi:MAG: UDP-N-acetylglucosamine--N-acetylmuramyl-(pentapeptide) pyrophosphoryl-undecaprenol N-acetylglucosamine transferase, partial [Rubrimonas sp.]
LALLTAPLALLRGTLAARADFRADPPAVVAGFGGYPAFPALAAATWLKLPRLIHEQNGVLGRVNRLFAPRVDAVACGTWPLKNPPAAARLIDMGNPVRPAVAALAGGVYQPPEADGPVDLLVFGGSQGAGSFSRLIPQALAAMDPAARARLRLTQQARAEDMDALRLRLSDLGVTAEIAPFFPDMPERLARAHLVVARAGASTVAELAAIGRPAVLIPYPAAMDDHQTANARALAQAGAAVVEAESGLTGEGLAAHLARLTAAPSELAAMAAAAAGRGRPDAAERLADLVEELGAGRSGP